MCGDQSRWLHIPGMELSHLLPLRSQSLVLLPLLVNVSDSPWLAHTGLSAGHPPRVGTHRVLYQLFSLWMIHTGFHAVNSPRGGKSEKHEPAAVLPMAPSEPSSRLQRKKIQMDL